MSHPSDRRSDGPADRRFERFSDRPSDRSGQRRPDGRGGSQEGRRFGERRPGGSPERPLGAGGASRWGGPGLRGRRPGAGTAADRPFTPGSGEVGRGERPGPGAAGRRGFRDGPRRGPSGEFGPGGERRRGGPERRGGISGRVGGQRGGGERFGNDNRGDERPAAGERWSAATPSRFPGSRRPDRPARPRPPLRLPPGRPSLIASSPSAASPAEAESHAPAAPADLIWGRHSALAALEAGRPLHRIWCTPELRFSPRFLQLLREAKASGVLVEEVTWARLGQLSGGAVHQGIVLQPAAAATLQLDTLIEGCRTLGDSPLLIAVDGLTDPQNLGAIVRSAEALGAHGMVLPQRRNAGLTGSVAKVAAGALEHLPVARVVNLNRSLDALKQEGYRVIGLAAEGTVTLEEADLSGPLVLVTGSEAEGLSLLTRRGCDQLVRIPLRGTTPSLNASVATALLLYEVARRSWMAGLRGTAPAPRLERPSLPEREPNATASIEDEAAGGAPEQVRPDDEPSEPAEPAASGRMSFLAPSGAAAGSEVEAEASAIPSSAGQATTAQPSQPPQPQPGGLDTDTDTNTDAPSESARPDQALAPDPGGVAEAAPRAPLSAAASAPSPHALRPLPSSWPNAEALPTALPEIPSGDHGLPVAAPQPGSSTGETGGEAHQRPARGDSAAAIASGAPNASAREEADGPVPASQASTPSPVVLSAEGQPERALPSGWPAPTGTSGFDQDISL